MPGASIADNPSVDGLCAGVRATLAQFPPFLDRPVAAAGVVVAVADVAGGVMSSATAFVSFF